MDVFFAFCETVSASNPLLFLEEPTSALAGKTGLAVDQLKFVLCLFFNFILAFVFKCLPAATAVKHQFNFWAGFLLCWYCFGFQTLNLVFTALVVYVLASSKSASMPQLVFGFTLAYMSVCHIWRQYTNWGGYDMDFTGPQMILTLKLSSFGFIVQDGRRFKKKEDSVTPDQKQYMLTELPGLNEFFGFVFFFGSILAGPACEFADYRAFVDTSLFKDYPTKGQGSSGSGKKGEEVYPYPSAADSIVTVAGKLALVVVMLVVMEVAKLYPVTYLLTPEYAAEPFWFRALYSNFSITIVRTKYYFAWFLAEAACIYMGIGYHGVSKEGAIKWDRLSPCWVLEVEGATNMRGCMNSWNLPTAHWLKHYVYLRLPRSVHSIRTYITFFVSALWHGFYVGYYLTFISAAFFLEVARRLRSLLQPKVAREDKSVPLWYSVGGWVMTSFALNYAAIPFNLLGWADSFAVWRLNGFYLHAVALLLFPLLGALAPKKEKKRGKEEAAAAGDATKKTQ